MKKYKNLQLSFLIEIFIVLGTILSISLMGSKGLAAISILALRPLLLEKETIIDEKSCSNFFRSLQSHLSNYLHFDHLTYNHNSIHPGIEYKIAFCRKSFGNYSSFFSVDTRSY